MKHVILRTVTRAYNDKRLAPMILDVYGDRCEATHYCLVHGDLAEVRTTAGRTFVRVYNNGCGFAAAEEADLQYRRIIIGHVGRAQVVYYGGLVGLKLPESPYWLPISYYDPAYLDVRLWASCRFRGFRPAKMDDHVSAQFI